MTECGALGPLGGGGRREGDKEEFTARAIAEKGPRSTHLTPGLSPVQFEEWT